MKKDVAYILAILIVVILLFKQCNNKQVIKEVETTDTIKKVIPKVLVIPEIKGEIKLKDSLIPLKKLTENHEKFKYLTKRLKEKLLKADDSIKRLNTFLEAIKLREYKKTYSDSLTEISVRSMVSGFLYDQDITYKLLEREVKYLDTTIYITKTIDHFPEPKRMVFAGGGVNTKGTFEASLLLKNRKNLIFGLGYDSEENINAKVYIPLFKY